MNHLRIVVATTAILIFGMVANTLADTVWIKGKPEPLFGQVISQSNDQIQIRLLNNGAYSATQTISLKQIDSLVINIDRQRLEKLTPDRPKEYREYAEELGSQTKDLAAIRLATRLYVLAADNSKGEQRYGALLGLASLATDDGQKRKYEMLLRLNAPDANQVKALEKKTTSQSQFSNAENQLMLTLILALRKEKSIEASKILRSPENRKSLKRWKDHCTLKEFERIAASSQPSKVQLNKLLSLELMIRGKASSNSGSRQDWADLAAQPANSLSILPTLDNATPVDPTKSIYRDGKWISP